MNTLIVIFACLSMALGMPAYQDTPFTVDVSRTDSDGQSTQQTYQGFGMTNIGGFGARSSGGQARLGTPMKLEPIWEDHQVIGGESMRQQQMPMQNYQQQQPQAQYQPMQQQQQQVRRNYNNAPVRQQQQQQFQSRVNSGYQQQQQQRVPMQMPVQQQQRVPMQMPVQQRQQPAQQQRVGGRVNQMQQQYSQQPARGNYGSSSNNDANLIDYPFIVEVTRTDSDGVRSNNVINGYGWTKIY